MRKEFLEEHVASLNILYTNKKHHACAWQCSTSDVEQFAQFLVKNEKTSGEVSSTALVVLMFLAVLHSPPAGNDYSLVSSVVRNSCFPHTHTFTVRRLPYSIRRFV